MDCDDVICWVGSDDKDGGMDVATVGARGVAGRVLCLGNVG